MHGIVGQASITIIALNVVTLHNRYTYVMYVATYVILHMHANQVVGTYVYSSKKVHIL